MNLSWGLATRFVFGRRGLLGHRTARVALASTGLGVVAMVVAMALMSGYRHELEERLLVGGADFGVYPFSRLSEEDIQAVASTLEGLDSVRSVERVAYGQGSLAGVRGMRQAVPVTVRGVDSGARFWSRTFALTEPNSIVLGPQLAKQLQVEKGASVRLMLLDVSGARPQFRYRLMSVEDVVSTGYHEFDRSWVIVGRDYLTTATSTAGSIEIALANDADLAAARSAIEDAVGRGYEVRDFRIANQALFEALAGQQVLLFLLLGLIVLVATVNVASALVVLIRERRRDLGVLAAVGLDGRTLGWTLFSSGLFLAAVGTGLGLLIGSVLSWFLDRWEVIRLGEELSAVYFLSAVPFHLRASDLFWVAALSLAAGALASLVPALRATRIVPSRALRAG